MIATFVAFCVCVPEILCNAYYLCALIYVCVSMCGFHKSIFLLDGLCTDFVVVCAYTQVFVF